MDSSNPLIERFCPELIVDLNKNDVRNASNDSQGDSFSSSKNLVSCFSPFESCARIDVEPYNYKETNINLSEKMTGKNLEVAKL